LQGSRCWRDRIAGKVAAGVAPGVERVVGVRLMLPSLAGVLVVPVDLASMQGCVQFWTMV
jgi:hypothetical protein